MHSSLTIVPIRRVLRTAPFWRELRRPSPHHARRRHRQRGMTLLEIMIVLAILALIMGLVVGPAVMRMFFDSKQEIAKATVAKLANEAYPMWLAANPGQRCPADLAALALYMNKKDQVDPWQTPYRLLCGDNLPPGVHGLAVVSSGPDAKADTGDDIKSWQ
jgi:prepilin-type N-terminal cleavage/methylation domain-containing protein